MRAASAVLVLISALPLGAQELAPPVPQKLVIHSKVLNEDRTIWVRMPAGAQGKKDRYAVAYVTDASQNINHFGSSIDFIANANLMPPLIVVAIANTDRVRDLTPTRADVKDPDGSVESYPTSGGADKFLDFIQTELVPEIDKRFSTQPFRIIVGHSLGGSFAIHALMNRPQLFQACIATSPSLWWDDFYTLRQAQQFFPKQKEFHKTLFFALANEGGPMGEGFDALRRVFTAARPAGFVVESARYDDELHRSTELRGHYAGLRTIFAGWPVPLDPSTRRPAGGLAGIEQHYRALSEHFGFAVSAERGINSFGYSLLGDKNIAGAMAAFERNVKLYPDSANVYDSLADALEAAGSADAALENARKAVELGTKGNDPDLGAFKRHLDRLLAAAAKSAPAAQRK
jgi:uncharacterized protein